jgi:hypothetical protein
MPEGSNMISCLLIVGLFFFSIIGLWLLGRRVPNPAEVDRSFEDQMGMLKNNFLALSRVMGEQLVPAMRSATEAVAKLGEAFAEAWKRDR